MAVGEFTRVMTGSSSSSVARRRGWLLASLFVAIALGEWTFWLGSEFERTPWWAGSVFLTFSLGAAIACFRTMGRLTGNERKAWRLFGLGCVSLLLGQTGWSIYDVILGVPVPSIAFVDVFYFGFPIFFIVGTWHYRSRAPSLDDAFVQVSNLGIILSATVIVCLFAYSGLIRAPISTRLAATTMAYSILDLSAPLFVHQRDSSR